MDWFQIALFHFLEIEIMTAVVNGNKTIIGKNSEDAIKAGIYFGTVGSVNHIINELSRVFGDLEYTIATGGDAKIFKKEIPKIDKFLPRLTLEGIRLAFEEKLNS